MPTVPSHSPATGSATSSSYIHTTDCNFVDNAGRTLLLRGVNLSGSSKAPVDRPSYIREDFWETAEAGGESFIGRPLNIDDGSADVHLARLSGWGFNMLRFPVTWESLEHEGPGKFDYDFMDYTVRVLRKCKEYGFRVYMDPHQDIWSRFSGGSGAPFWTLAACGINPRNFTATQAAILHCEYPLAHDPDPASLPAMIWSTNYGRLLSQTLFTLFFAGQEFAPRCVIDGMNIQDYLQSHFIEAMGQMADRIRAAGDLLEDCVIGWDSMNEPSEGLCGWVDLSVNPSAQGSTLRKGTYPTPLQSFRLGVGQAQTVDSYSFGAFGPSRDGTVTVDPKGRSIWASPDDEPDGVHPTWGWKRDVNWPLGTCIWAHHGVWDIETGFLMLPNYFQTLPGTDTMVEFLEDFWKPHFIAFARRIRAAHPEAILFVQPPVFARPVALEEDILAGRGAYSAHYYDGLTLISRHWNWFNADALGLLRGHYKSTLQAVKIGTGAIRKSLQEQLGILKADALTLGAFPTIIGEIGTPFDMDSKRAYYGDSHGRGVGDYSQQEKALDASLNGADGPNAVNWTVWTYCPDSSHEWGDGWNMEDLSLWSADDMRTPRSPMYKIGSDESSATAAYGSEAVLLKKSGVTTTVISAANSTLTLPTGTGLEAAGWRANPYDFLTDGARAVRAFCRPWPIKLVGTSRSVEFDIASTLFRLVVNVRPQDRLRPEEDDDELASEIFVPLVHYANARLLRDSDTRSVASLDEELPTGKTSMNASTVNLPMLRDMTASTSSASTEVASMDLRVTAEKGRELVDVDVSVSAGRWAIEGQTLRWWYDVPAAGEAERQFTIEIRRRGGGIKTTDLAPGWTESLCPPESCSIM
ncbi:Glycoside hydrolase family 5 protein [Mycena indigotica]|uniref:Glycoside hydrolase family 5 protein n=1 Tax=Mycena indigotica TaxID=2126181 RepID=A0A8H6S964_9AGAR|nr:Glycoside hydrolase family 5 protein [Mycena indigotica]KAF7295266.1 Glycoside hydrolase family 5 protein [Mycena indigotica]